MLLSSSGCCGICLPDKCHPSGRQTHRAVVASSVPARDKGRKSCPGRPPHIIQTHICERSRGRLVVRSTKTAPRLEARSPWVICQEMTAKAQGQEGFSGTKSDAFAKSGTRGIAPGRWLKPELLLLLLLSGPCFCNKREIFLSTLAVEVELISLLRKPLEEESGHLPCLNNLLLLSFFHRDWGST